MEDSKKLQVVVISRQTIKPSSPSPSPNNQETFKLSLLDQFSVPYYVPILLFYKDGCGAKAKKFEERSQHLKSSLSETLTHFYPFAGRLRDHLTFICNDEGAGYSEARVLNSTLSGVLEKPDPKRLSLFLPEESPSHDFSTRPPLMVKVSFFGCGGMVLGMKFCHKIADAGTCASFIKGWAESAHGNKNPVIADFSSASALFPPVDSLESPPQVVPLQELPGVRASRFVFGPSELAALQANIQSRNGKQPTRVEAVTSLLYRAVLEAKKEKSIPKPSVLFWAVNLRPRLQPPLLEHCFGNFVVLPVVVDQGHDIDHRSALHVMAANLRKGTIDICNQYIKILKGDNPLRIQELQIKSRKQIREALTGTVDLYIISSWCKFPLYEADFGWGKPVWVTTGGMVQSTRMTMLMDTSDGLGIEAWVCLMEQDMDVLESNQELHEFASLNPSAFQ